MPPRSPRASRAPSSYVSRCASTSADALRFCAPLKMWKPRNASPADSMRAATPAAADSSMPNGLAPPPIFMPDALSSNAGFTRIASCGATPRRSPASSAWSSWRSDSRLIVMPAATACEISSAVLPGPAKLMSAGAVPVSSAMRISAADATSRPSVRLASHCTTAGIGLALIA